MSTLSLEEPELPMAIDDFGALEQRVLRTVELVKAERVARSEAEQRAVQLQKRMEAQAAQLEEAQQQVRTLEREREQVRQRVERLLRQLDEVGS